ncbi:MAG: PEP-CTERM sorting domain-containing protein [Armatimonadota bacterium]|nr:PEP-CTERM sorting domain-containing protein [Armatimonadota bacterium]
MNKSLKLGLFAAAAVGCAAAVAIDFPEVEANDSKAAANAFGMAIGDTISGTSTGTSVTVPGIASADYFRVTTAADVLGIYRWRTTLTTNGTAGHTGTIRGLTQTGGVINAGTDASFQSSSTLTTPPRYNQWYGFGKGESLFYRVTGGVSTTAPYLATLSRDLIVPTDIGSFAPGNITITTEGQGHTTDTDMWIYDSNLNAIPGYGNDDTLGGTGFESTLTRSYGAGRYYMALTNFQFANNQPAAADDNFQTGQVMDFADIAANSSTSVNLNMAFAVTDSAGISQFASLKASQYDVNWYTFVVPEPTTIFGCVAGLGLLLARRRFSK